MAKITRYQQGELASAVVGTPGVDRSGDMLLSSTAGVAAAQAEGLEASNQVMRREADQNYLENEAYVRQQQAQAFQSVGQELTLRARDQRKLEQQAIDQAYAEQQARWKEQEAAIRDQAISNANLKFGMDANAAWASLRENKNLMPEKLPDLLTGHLTRQRDEYAKGLPPAVATKFIADSNRQIEALHKQATDTALTYATQKVADERRVLEDQMADAVKDETGLNKLVKRLTKNEDDLQSQYRVHGAKMDGARQRVIDRATENMLRSTTVDGNPQKTLDLIDSHKYDYIGESKIQTLKGNAQAAQAAKEKEHAKQESIGETAEIAQAEKLISEINDDPTSPQYYGNLVKGRQKLTDQIEIERSKPVKDENSPKFDPETGAPIEYQRPTLVKHLDAKRKEIDGLINSEKKEQKADAKAAAAAAKEQTKEKQAEYRRTANLAIDDELLHFRSPEGEKARDGLRVAMEDLRFAINGHKRELGRKQKHTTSVDEAMLYHIAVRKFQKARAGGFIDEPGKRTGIATSYLKELESIGMKLMTDKPSDISSQLTGPAWALLHASAPPPLHRILNEWNGRRSDDVDTEYIGRMVSAYNQFKRVTNGLEPSEATIQQWRQKVTDNMHRRGMGLK